MNNCVFDARLARDAELRDVGDKKVCNFSAVLMLVMVTIKTLWLDCSIWGKEVKHLMIV